MNLDFTLPMPADAFIPHRPPMQLVDTLLSFDNAAGVVEAIPKQDCLLVNREGELDPVALVELLAQGYATIKGYADLSSGGEISEGFLVGVRKFRITGTARVGDRLLIKIRTIGSFEGFAVAEGEIERDGEVIAGGSIKLWIVDRDLETGER
jgi:predicted hotdog family 3-hydroxylacyl-ACP dehydratase